MTMNKVGPKNKLQEKAYQMTAEIESQWATIGCTWCLLMMNRLRKKRVNSEITPEPIVHFEMPKIPS